MPVSVIVPLNIEFNGGSTNHLICFFRHRNQLLQEQHNQGFTMLLVEVLLSISSTICMTTLFQTIPSSETLLVLCSQSLFYSVSWEKGLEHRALEGGQLRFWSNLKDPFYFFLWHISVIWDIATQI